MKCKTILFIILSVYFIAACSGDKEAKAPQSQQAATAPSTTASAPVPESPKKETAESVGGACWAIFEAECTECHNETRVCQKIGKKSETRWKRTIARMIKRGAKISSADTKKLVKCLTEESADIVAKCQ